MQFARSEVSVFSCPTSRLDLSWTERETETLMLKRANQVNFGFEWCLRKNDCNSVLYLYYSARVFLDVYTVEIVIMHNVRKGDR